MIACNKGSSQSSQIDAPYSMNLGFGIPTWQGVLCVVRVVTLVCGWGGGGGMVGLMAAWEWK